jgi:hypothetical protein
MNPDDENPAYRSPVNLTPRTTAPAADEKDFSTLKELLKIARDADVKARDINSVDLSNPNPKLSAEVQIYGMQWALDNLITPFLNTVEEAVKNVHNQNTGEES